MLSALLDSTGYEVVGALEDGSAIMATIQQTSPDVVCLDYMLPGRDGLDILREINETSPQIDVVFMTASNDASIEQQAADHGAAGFLRKPFGQSQIINELKQVCDTRSQAAASIDKSTSPQGDKAPDTGASASSSLATVAPYNPRGVVIADDNGAIRLLLKGLLNGLGLQVVQLTSNGRDAVAAAKAHQPGILCLDVNMPIMSGFEALPLIRQVSPRTLVVMVTASASREFVEKASSLGAKGFVVKPIRPAYVEAFVKKLIK